MRYALNLEPETNRVLSVTESDYAHGSMPRVDEFPTPVTDYLYINGEFVYDPLPKPAPEEHTASPLMKLEAQITYTAMMTDTLLEV